MRLQALALVVGASKQGGSLHNVGQGHDYGLQPFFGATIPIKYKVEDPLLILPHPGTWSAPFPSTLYHRIL